MQKFSRLVCLILLSIVVLAVLASCGKTREEILRDLYTAPRDYPPAKTLADQVENINGFEVRDPYRWMEEEGAAKDWIEKQNNYTDSYLINYEYDGLEERLSELFNIGFISGIKKAGGRYFYLKRDDEDQEQPVLQLLSGDVERALIDLNTIDPEQKTSLDWYYPSLDGRLLAYGLSKDGSENSTLHIMEVNSGKKLKDEIPETRHSSLAWLPDKSGFFYTRYPEGDRYNRKAYFHKLSSDWKDDLLIFGDKRDPADWTNVTLSEDGKHLLVAEYHGWTDTDLYLYDMEKKELKTLFIEIGAMFHNFKMRKGTIYALTNFNAPKWRLVAIPPKTSSEPGDWRTVIPEGDWPVESFLMLKNRIVLNILEKVASKLLVYDLEGQSLGNVELPTFGMVDGLSGEPDSDGLVYTFNSFFYPSTMFTVDLSKPGINSKQLQKVKADINQDDYIARQVEYPSYDGTRVNMFIVHKKRLALDGLTPTLLYGYGGFQVSMTPHFSRRAMTWIERGGVFAVAGIRGGGEYGEDWHQAGMLDKKFQVFKDFEFAMRYLHKNNYTQPDKLIIEGGSNGGLLMGAMMTEVPHLFAGAISSVGLYDMVRYHKFPPGELWISEYGSADRETDTGYILGYSPYHQVMDGAKYPAFYGHTADTDTRVPWVHTAKFVARLQAASTSLSPILFHLDTRAGHGMGKSKSDVTKEYIAKMKFMFSIVGDPALKHKK